jgi:hypothetical protein
MSDLRGLPSLVFLTVVFFGSTVSAEDHPPLIPTRDVDITYDVSRPNQPGIRERVRWSASQHLQRVDGPDRSATIFNHNAHEITLLNSSSRTFRKLEGTPRRPPQPGAGALLKRGGRAVIAGLECVEWSWLEDGEGRTVCTTADGVLLRLVIDGVTIMQARSVSYGSQAATLFEVPSSYAPALAPEGLGEP